MGISKKSWEMIEWPKISIVTPSYNQGQYIEKTIVSVLDQDYPNLEYIIIDGGSTDNTLEVIKKYGKWINYWISEPDQGQSHAINKGLAKCTGEIFNWLNSDDYYYPNTLKTVGKTFLEAGTSVVSGYARRFNDADNSTESIVRLEIAKELEESLLFNSFRQPSTFFRLGDIVELGGVNSLFNYCMDSELFFRYLLKHGQEKIILIDELLVNYRLHNNSKTIANSKNFLVERDKLFQCLAYQLSLGREYTKILHSGKKICDNQYELNKVKQNKLSAYLYLFCALKTPRKNFNNIFQTILKAVKKYPYPKRHFYKVVAARVFKKYKAPL